MPDAGLLSTRKAQASSEYRYTNLNSEAVSRDCCIPSSFPLRHSSHLSYRSIACVRFLHQTPPLLHCCLFVGLTVVGAAFFFPVMYTFARQKTLKVVVDFHASWCGPCKRIAPFLVKLSETHKDSVVFVKVSHAQE